MSSSSANVPASLASGAVRRLQARAQSRGVVMLTVGVPALGADLRLTADDDQWVGLGDGHGVATGRRVLVEVGGRRMPRPRRASMWLPDTDGCVAATEIDACWPSGESSRQIEMAN